MEADILVGRRLKKKLAALADAGNSREMERAKRRIGVMALQDQQAHYRAGAAGGFAPLGDVAVMLRPGGPKIFGPTEIALKRQGVKILRDSNRLYASLRPQAPGNVLDVLPAGVRVGSSVRYGSDHFHGRRVRFRFGREEEARFDRNVSAVKAGFRRPARRADGKRHSWAARGKESPWSEFYFKAKAGLRKMHGKSYKLPARRFLRRPVLRELTQYARVVVEALARLGGG